MEGPGSRERLAEGFALMPSLEWNRSVWARDYDWSDGGEEWSRPYGNSEMQWYGSLLPRVHRFLPASHIVEIAPGFGRWTRFLVDMADKVTLIELSEACLDACRDRFADRSHVQYVLNDGRSLSAIPDGSADFFFCFDSLVQAEMDVLSGYIAQMRAKLTPHGVAFIHHSNAARALIDGCPPEYFLDRGHHRAASVSADAVASAAQRHGLICRTQELLPLGSPTDPSAEMFFLDCITTLALPGSRWDGPRLLVENSTFSSEASCMRSIAPLYGGLAMTAVER